MSVLFVSHASRSDAGASTILAWLREWGYDAVFVDHDVAEGLVGGEPWEERLYTELRRCRALIALVDSAWLGSKWCIAEANHAQALRKPVIPIYLEDRKSSETFAKLLAANAPPVFARVQSLTTVALEDTKARLKQALSNLGLDAANVFSFKGSRPPYPGLPPFEKDDAPVFFGRDQEITDLLALLNSCRAANRPRWVQIQGASGSGKSSLLRAGLLPRLERDADHWIILPPFRPLADPLRELAQVLSSPLPAPTGAEAAVVAAWAQWIIDAAATIRSGAQRPEATVLLSIDQLEEAVNPSRAGAVRDEDSPDRATLFLIALREALARSDHRLLVISTLRADTIGDFQRHRALRERSSQGDVIRVEARLIGTLPKASFFAIIQGPADLAGLRFDEGLVGRMVDETATDDALPLLAFALRELWDRYGKADLRISKDEYDLFGGIEKSVGDRAEAEYRNWMDSLAARGVPAAEIEAQSEQFRRLMFTHFAGITDDGRLIRSPVAWADIPAGLKDIVEAFRDARLMTADEEKVEVAHDALFRRWDRLAEWRKQIGGALAELRLVKRIYAERTNQADLIPEGHQLEQAKRLLTSGLIQGDSALATFVTSSMKQADFHRGRRRFWKRLGQAASVAVALVGVIATVLFFVASDRQRAALNERDRAFLSEATRLASLSRAELAKGNVRMAVELTLEALPAASDGANASWLPPWLRDLFAERPLPVSKTAEGALMEALLASSVDEPWLVGHQAGIDALAWSPNGLQVATGSQDGTVRIWDIDTGRQRRMFRIGNDDVVAVVWSADGSKLAISTRLVNSVSGALWDVATGKRIRVIAEQDGELAGIIWTSDAASVLAVTPDGKGRLWDAGTGLPKGKLESHDNRITQGVWSPDGTMLATRLSDKTVRVWSATDGRQLAVLPQETAFSIIAWSSTGRIAAASGEEIQIWDPGNGHIKVALPLDGVSAMAWSADGSRLAIGSMFQNSHIWRSETNSIYDLAVRVPATAIIWSPDGTKLVTQYYGAAWLWNAANGEAIGKPFALGQTIGRTQRMSWSPDSTHIALTQGEAAGLWNTVNDRRSGLLGHHWDISQLSWSADGKRIATASADGTGRIWTVEEHQRAVVGMIDDTVNDIAWNPGGNRIALGLVNGTAQIWDAATARTIAAMSAQDGYTTSVEWDPGGGRIATVSSDNVTRIWNAETGELGASLSGHRGNVRMAVWNPDGRRIATASDDATVVIWDAASGRRLTHKQHRDAVIKVAWSPDGNQVASADSEGVHIWAPDQQQSITLRNSDGQTMLSFAWSPDGTQLAIGSGVQSVGIWDARTGEETRQLVGNDMDADRIVWSPDGKLVAIASILGAGSVWDARSGLRLSTLRGHDGSIKDIAWSATGDWIATVSTDTTMRIWDPASGKEISRYGNRETVMAWDPAGKRLASYVASRAVEISPVPPENLPLWLDCALGQVPVVGLPDVRDDFFLAAAPQQGSAAARLQENYADRYAVAQEACAALLQ
jgi:WD40 repeat protein